MQNLYPKSEGSPLDLSAMREASFQTSLVQELVWPDANGHETDVLGVGVDESDEHAFV